MIIALANIKGGVGKTTSAVHLAACLQLEAPTLLLDGDDTRNATAWSLKGEGFPFKVASIEEGAKLSRHYEHTVIDTGQKPSEDELRALMRGSDLLIVPAVPAGLDNDGLALTINTLRNMGSDSFRVLLTRVPPPPEPEGPSSEGRALEAGRTYVFGRHSPAKSLRQSRGCGHDRQQRFCTKQGRTKSRKSMGGIPDCC